MKWFIKWFIALAFAAALSFGSQPTSGAEKPSPARQLQFNVRQLQFNVRVLEGDPLGSLEAGTLKVLAAPRLVTAQNRPFSVFSGGERTVPNGEKGAQLVQYGRIVEGKSGEVKEGKVHIDLTLSNTTVVAEDGERIQLHTESTRIITTVRLGEVVKFRWNKGSADKQVWAELLVEEVKP